MKLLVSVLNSPFMVFRQIIIIVLLYLQVVLCAIVAIAYGEEPKKDKRGLLGLGLGLEHSAHISLGHELHAAPIVHHAEPIHISHHVAEPIHISHHHVEPLSLHHSAHLGYDHLGSYPYAHDYHDFHAPIVHKTFAVKKTIATPIISKSYIAEPLHFDHHDLLHAYHH